MVGERQHADGVADELSIHCERPGQGAGLGAQPVGQLFGQRIGIDLAELETDPGLLSRTLLGDSQFRWLGPESGVIRMAVGALVNAGWDLLARRAGLPMWKYLAGLSPAQLVSCIDFFIGFR